ncbi:MAG TPA: DsbC family protein [Steroidobacteraceae bacterium]|nr:DsbC family protein [Steroidobacteraceae bacterium]
MSAVVSFRQMMRRIHPALTALGLLALAVVAAWATSGRPAAAQGAAGATPQGLMSPVGGASAGVAAPISPVTSSGAPGGPDGVAATPIAGLVEVRRGADIVYMSRDGKYVITGDLYQVGSHEDLTELRRRELRRDLISAVPESQMVIFSPPHPKYTVTVFTDVDCVYCRAMHGQIADYNQLGIKVRYMFFPRTGPNTSSWYKAEQVWCSPDRRAALTRAKLGEPLAAKICPNTPVAREYALGEAIGLEGTPGVIAANGALVGGYLTPPQLIAALQQSAKLPTSDQQTASN